MRPLAVPLALAFALSAPGLVCVACVISTDGLAGPPRAADAAPDVESDVVVPSDAGPDAHDASTRYCATQTDATFCADFDESLDPTVGFSGTVASLSNLSLVTDAISAPSSLSAHADPSTDPGQSNESSTRIYYDLPFVAKTVHVELDTKLCDPGSAGFEFMKVETSSNTLRTPAPGYESSDIALGGEDGASALGIEYFDTAGNNPSGASALTIPFATGVWMHIALDVVFATDATGSVKLVVDHEATPRVAESGIITESAAVSTTRIVVGSFTANDANDCTNLVDNVLVQASP